VGEATALADWVALHDRRLTTIYNTHGRGDHYLGLPVVLDRFPDARAVVTAGTVRQMQQQHAQALDNSLRTRFPVRSPTRPRCPSHSSRQKPGLRTPPSR
jgi:glyoxylase-like metal-dependent hydrolase (beta-lactamase superfamily II)